MSLSGRQQGRRERARAGSLHGSRPCGSHVAGMVRATRRKRIGSGSQVDAALVLVQALLLGRRGLVLVLGRRRLVLLRRGLGSLDDGLAGALGDVEQLLGVLLLDAIVIEGLL